MYCPRCGTDYSRADQQCSRCGYALSEQPRRKKIVPILFLSFAIVAMVSSIALFIVSNLGDDREPGAPTGTTAFSDSFAEPTIPDESPLQTDDIGDEEAFDSMEDLGLVQVNDNAEVVTITIPAGMVTEDMEEPLEQADLEMGIISKTIRFDGSVEIEYERRAYEQYLATLAAQVENDLNQMKERYSFIRSVGFEDEFSVIDVYVDNTFDMNVNSLALYNIGVLGYKYQVFSGSTQANVSVVLVDYETMEPFDWVMYP